MPLRTPARLFLFVASLVALLVGGVVPLAVTVGVPGGIGPSADPAGAEERPLRPGPAYWLAAADGGVFAFARGAYEGGASGTQLRTGVAGIANTPSGNGYWLVARDGGVFAFGDAPYHGGAADVPLNNPIIDIAATPTGQGYWLVGADGGVFAFGDARWFGGAADTALNSPITAIVASRGGEGYWLVARDGGVFAFGDAPWLGGVTGLELSRAVVDMVATRSGRGYWLASSDGGVFAFGDAAFLGSAADTPLQGAVVGIATSPVGQGYWMASSDGGVYAFGDAGFYGSITDGAINRPVVGIAAGVGTAIPRESRQLLSSFGWDVSWPQCGKPLPSGQHGYAVIGVTDGHLWDMNPCLAEQHRWSTRGGALGGLYVNVNWPSRAAEPNVAAQMADTCGLADLGCQMYQWGFRGVSHAVAEATDRGVSAPMWWLDVETANRWSPDKGLNAQIVRGAIDALRKHDIKVGIYSTWYQWGVIAGDFAPGLPNWVAGPNNVEEAARACTDGPTFGGGVPWMVQYPYQGFDGNLICQAGVNNAMTSFKVPPPPPVPELPEVPPLEIRILAVVRAI